MLLNSSKFLRIILFNSSLKFRLFRDRHSLYNQYSHQEIITKMIFKSMMEKFRQVYLLIFFTYE